MIGLPKPVTELCKLISKMPGFSERGAERFLDWWWHRFKDREEFCSNWEEFNKYKPCKNCFFFALKEEMCDFCKDDKRNKKSICVVSSSFGIPLIEKEGVYDGLYFVLDGDVIGSRNYKSVELVKQRIAFLKSRVEREGISEIIMATDFTSKGEATALFIKDFLKNTNVELSRLAQGFHAGDSLGYSDPITLKKAFENREKIS